MATYQFHTRLNPHLWRADHTLIPLVRLKLFQSALAFYKFLDLPSLIVSDIIMTGSNAAYNYTRLSDIDVHLIVDLAAQACPALSQNLFLTKKALWGQTYQVTVHGFPIELYVEDAAEPVQANGIYSLIHDRWLKRPSPERPSPDDSAIRQKRETFIAQIDSLLSGDDVNDNEIAHLLNRLRALRQNGLLHGGEFSTENLVYKSLRDGGYLTKLYNQRIALRDRELSL